MHTYEIAVIGAGASGLMFASQLGGKKKVLIIDANDTFAPKLKISGGGKCNATNEVVTGANYLGDSAFVEKVLSTFGNRDFMKFCKDNLLELKRVDRVVQGQLFCIHSSLIIDLFKKLSGKCEFRFGHKVVDVNKNLDIFEIITDRGNFYAKKLVVASGGVSYPILNATDIGYKIATKFGHKIVQPSPALVGFTVQKDEFWFKQLCGVSLDVKLQVDGKTFFGGFLFTHRGTSGPVVLNASLWWKKGAICLDFLPKIQNIEVFLKPNKNKNISTALPLPKNFVKVFLNKIGLSDNKICDLTKEDFQKLAILKDYTFSPAGNFGFSKAEVTKGGICTDEIDDNNFQSKLCKNLFFIGEVLDVTGELGGYNLQWAFSSAKICGDNLNL